jgi:hypothetical protein
MNWPYSTTDAPRSEPNRDSNTSSVDLAIDASFVV